MYLITSFILVASFVMLLIIMSSINKMQSRKHFAHKVENFSSYIALLEYHMVKAYDIIYKDRILIYSLEATKITDQQFNIIAKEFAIFVMKLIGENLKNEFVDLYGNEQTFILNLIEYFNTRFENDEIRERSKSNLFSDENINNEGKLI